MLKKVYQKLQLLLPSEPCALCNQPVEGELPLCRHCRASLPNMLSVPLALQQHKAWDRVVVPYHYKTPLAPLIHQLKFGHKLHLARLFGRLMLEHLQQQNIDRPDQILPIPLHNRRLRERGFNQALEIIRGPAKSLGIPLTRHSCERSRATPAQSRLNAAHRKENLKGAFTVHAPLEGAHIAIFDDVITTGTTMEMVAHALKQQGAETIQIWALAYTPPHR